MKFLVIITAIIAIASMILLATTRMGPDGVPPLVLAGMIAITCIARWSR